MARKATHKSSAASAKSTPLKRASSSAIATPSRQSKRAKKSPATSASSLGTKRSKYFDKESETSEAESNVEDEGSGYEIEDLSGSAISSPPEFDEEADEDEEDPTSEDDRPRKRKRGTKGTGGTISGKAGKGQELWRPGVKTGLAPGEQVFIKLPKARQAGKIPYKDDTIHQNTMLFLNDLKENNDREWLKVHDADYRQSKNDFDTFIERLTEKIIEKDETIPELPPKDVTFRIYRDIRFSPDPTPYKTYFSAAWSRTGRKGPYAHYYLQIQPGGSFIGGGIWHPDAPPLALLRQDVDRKSHKLKKALLDAGIRKEFLKGVSNDEKKAVKAFVGQNSENMLKTKPKGFEADNPNIDLLRLRNYTIGRKLTDDEVLNPKSIIRISELMGVMTPFITYLNSVVMPDDDNASSESAGDDEGDNDNSEEAEE